MHNNLGIAHQAQGKLDDALICFRKALDLKPDFPEGHSNLLFTLHYQRGVTLADLAAAHAEYERRYAAPLRTAWTPHANARDPDRRLRLGFVSPDFGQHPVGFFLVRVMENFDRSHCDTICYSSRFYKDEITNRMEAAARHL